jgi:hypothetical protein
MRACTCPHTCVTLLSGVFREVSANQLQREQDMRTAARRLWSRHVLEEVITAGAVMAFILNLNGN